MELALEKDRLETVAWLQELEKSRSDEKKAANKARPLSAGSSSTHVPSNPSQWRELAPPSTQSSREIIQGAASTARRFSEPLFQGSDSSGTERRSSADPSEALKRGRSFGPLPKPSSRQGILKSSAGISPRIVGSATQEIRAQNSSGEINAADEPEASGLDETTRSSDDDDDEMRGRKRTVDGRETASDSPAVTVTPPTSEQTTSKRFMVKPKTNFDHSASRERAISPTPADIENLEEIRKAQRLGVAISTTDTPESHKVIRTILRGDYGYFQDQAREENRRVRTYLLAVNTRPEAAYATEWAIGTVLRDGDTLMAIFAVDKDAETGLPEDGLPIGEGGKAMRETTAEIDKMTAASQKSSRLFGMKSLLPGSRKSSVAAEARVSKSSKKQQERMRALERLSDLCVDLLRKTKLQVRVVIEVIHCKVARYMLTEAIDVLQPTLVIVGSRGRSIMKGALAGSFSRYLIMKSSVPVMTARMKLSSHKVKSHPPRIRLGNNLVPSMRFADVKIDELESRLERKSDDNEEAEV